VHVGVEIGLRVGIVSVPSRSSYLAGGLESWCDVLDMATLTRYEDGDQRFFSDDLTHLFAHLGERHRGVLREQLARITQESFRFQVRVCEYEP
jgi:hypothetical protein